MVASSIRPKPVVTARGPRPQTVQHGTGLGARATPNSRTRAEHTMKLALTVLVVGWGGWRHGAAAGSGSGHTFSPVGDPDLISPRTRSPAAMCATPSATATRVEYVPLPTPGGPRKTHWMRSGTRLSEEVRVFRPRVHPNVDCSPTSRALQLIFAARAAASPVLRRVCANMMSYYSPTGVLADGGQVAVLQIDILHVAPALEQTCRFRARWRVEVRCNPRSHQAMHGYRGCGLRHGARTGCPVDKFYLVVTGHAEIDGEFQPQYVWTADVTSAWTGCRCRFHMLRAACRLSTTLRSNLPLIPARASRSARPLSTGAMSEADAANRCAALLSFSTQPFGGNDGAMIVFRHSVGCRCSR